MYVDRPPSRSAPAVIGARGQVFAASFRERWQVNGMSFPERRHSHEEGPQIGAYRTNHALQLVPTKTVQGITTSSLLTLSNLRGQTKSKAISTFVFRVACL